MVLEQISIKSRKNNVKPKLKKKNTERKKELKIQKATGERK